MTKNNIDKLANEMVKDMPWHHAADIRQDLSYLNTRGLLHPSHDDIFYGIRKSSRQNIPKYAQK